MKLSVVIFSILVSFLFPLLVRAGSVEEAAEKYRQGAYGQSREIWLSLIGEGYNNAELYLNVGNTYLMEKNYPPAILYYQKCLVRDPRMKAAAEHLKKAQEEAEVEPVSLAGNILVEAVDRVAVLLPGTLWLFLFSLALSGFIWLGFRSGFRRFAWILVPAMAFLTLALRENNLRDRSGQVVLKEHESLRASPDQASLAVSEIRAGETLKVIDQIGPWIKVEASGTSIGWIPLEQVWVID